ncbi:MAG: hypothetical protein KJ587_01135 [Alphaproteobacteria bacterium]|nr:hypothetical protein [Alphaproteobacteria bacterium]
MDCNKTRKGRPKGSGIDDSRRLREIAAMIIEDPELRPTTAIRNTGICDPSTIRRLRDKFNSEKAQLFQELGSQDRLEKQYDNRISHNALSGQSPAENRTMALNHKREPARTAPLTKPSDPGPTGSAAAGRDGEPRRDQSPQSRHDNELHRLLADNLRAASAIWRFQFVMTTQYFQSPVVRSALRYQLAFSQTLFGFGGPQPAGRSA